MSKLWVGESNCCWLDIWDQPGFKGRHSRLWGPNDYPLLRVGEHGWNPNVMSLRVGRGAYVQMYEDLNVEPSVIWLLPNQSVENIAVVSGSDELDSLRLYDRPPFAREPGYPAYMLWAAHQLERASTAPPHDGNVNR